MLTGIEKIREYLEGMCGALRQSGHHAVAEWIVAHPQHQLEFVAMCWRKTGENALGLSHIYDFIERKDREARVAKMSPEEKAALDIGSGI